MSSQSALAEALLQTAIIQPLDRLVRHSLEVLVERMAHLVLMEVLVVAVAETSEPQEAEPLARGTREEQIQLLVTVPVAVAVAQERLVVTRQQMVREAVEAMDQARIQPGQQRQALDMTAATTPAVAVAAVALQRQAQLVLAGVDVVREELRRLQQLARQTLGAEAVEITASLRQRQQVADQES